MEALTVNFEGIPAELASRSNWVLWKLVDGKKPPYSATSGMRVDITKSTGVTLSEVRAVYERGGYAGIGYILHYGLVAIDLDACIDSMGYPSERADDIMTDIWSYSELSPSGTGMHILTHANIDRGRRRGNVEMYSEGHYITVTGHMVKGCPSKQVEHSQGEVDSLYTDLAPIRSTQPRIGVWNTKRSDDEVLQRAMTAKNGGLFKRYWTGDKTLWTGRGAKHASQSEVDYQLVKYLLYWTNQDVAQVDRLFRQSGLYRVKWDEIHGDYTYGEKLINDARGLVAS